MKSPDANDFFHRAEPEGRTLAIAYSPIGLCMARAALACALPGGHMDLLCLTNDVAAATAFTALAAAFPAMGSVTSLTWDEAAALHATPQILAQSRLQNLAAPLLRRRATARLRKIFGTARYDAIFFQHDVSAACRPVALAAAWPKAELICFGDSFGMFFDAKLFFALLGFTFPRYPFLSDPTPARYIAALPADTYGTIPETTPVQTIPKETVLGTLRQARAGFPFLTEYLHKLTARYAFRPRTLLMTDNHAEAGHIALKPKPPCTPPSF